VSDPVARIHQPDHDGRDESAAAAGLGEVAGLLRELVAVNRELLAAIRDQGPGQAAAAVPEDTVDYEGLGELTGLSRSALERLKARGELPPCCTPAGCRRVRWRRRVVLDWISRREAEQARPGRRR
jgi:predicted DNA-binding transcriptional regulator AlpA